MVLAIALACLLTGLLPRSTSAQLSPQRQWAVFRQADGLLSNDVYSILVDDGAIWFGSSRGVNRFDGRWRSFPISLIVSDAGQQRGITTPGVVTTMTGAAHGAGIWIATDNGYVSHWDGARWQLAATLGDTINDMVDIDGVLWLATQRGLYLLDKGLLRTVRGLEDHAIHDIAIGDNAGGRAVAWLGADDGLWRISLAATGLQHVKLPVIEAAALDLQDITDLADADPSLAQPLAGPIQALWSDGGGNLWLGSGAVVTQFNLKLGLGRFFQPFEDLGNAPVITDIAGTPDKRIWIASAGAGVAQYMLDDGLLAAASNLGSSAEGGLDTDIVRSLAIDQDNTLWFASPVGVFRYQLWAWLETDARLDGLAVNDLLYDHEGSLWVATGGEGIQRRDGLYANPVVYYPIEGGLPSEFVYDLEEDHLGDIWAATAGGVAVYRNGGWLESNISPVLPSHTIQSLQADNQGMWIGTSAGLAYYRASDGSVHNEAFFDGKSIALLERDGLGQLWVAAKDDDLWVSGNDGRWRDARHLGANAPLAGEATALLPDPITLGGMYVAFLDAGIYRWSGEEWVDFDRQRWPRGDRIEALALEQTNGSLWIGSEIGLSRLDALHLTTYDSHDGMQNGAIRSIAAEPQGGHWFGGQKGLTFYEDEHTPPWIEMNTISSPGSVPKHDEWQIFAGRTVQVYFTLGDMQSPPDKLKVFYRLNRHGIAESWREANSSPLVLRLETPDTVDLELMVRDQAFNYSPAVVRRLAVIAPPATVQLPVLGEIESPIFQLLLVFGALAFFGFGYVSYEIFIHHRRVNEAIRRGFNPYISGEPVRREEMFYGRHDLLARIVATLHNNSIMIHGERRIGKTTLLYQLANALRQVQDVEYWFVPVLIDLEGTAEEQLFLQLGEEIYQAVICLPDLSPAAVQNLHYLLCHQAVDAVAANGTSGYSDREFSRDLRTLVRVLEQYCKEHQDGRQLRLILLLDEVDTLSHFNHIYQQQLRRIFMRDFAATLGAVVAGIAISKEWDRIESPWYNLFNEIAMQPFDRDEAINLLVEPVRGYYLYEPAALSFIVDHSDGRPYRIQQYALEAVNHMLKCKRRRILLEDVAFAHQQILATILNEQAGHEQATDGPTGDEPMTDAAGRGVALSGHRNLRAATA